MKIFKLKSDNKHPRYFANVYQTPTGNYALTVNRVDAQGHNGKFQTAPITTCFHVSMHEARIDAICYLDAIYQDYNDRFNGGLYVMSESFGDVM